MIKIQKFPPPPKYEGRVKRRGQRYLAKKPNPTSKEFARHAYWQAIHDDLYNYYNGICAYCASWTPRKSTSRSDNTSVDHFLPKSINPNLAYEWGNYRLCRALLNRNKGNTLDVMDPMFINNDWFCFDFTTFLIKPNSGASLLIIDRVKKTINILGLNTDDYVDERVEIIKLYCCDNITIDDLESRYPFIANEIRRINFDNTLKDSMRTYFACA